MDNISQYSDALDMAFKLVGILVAMYIAPIKKSMDTMSMDLKRVQTSVEKLNMHVAVMFEKHEKNEGDIRTIKLDILSLRERHHELVNNNINKIELNELRIESLENRAKNL